MACFAVPLAEAVVVSAVKVVALKKDGNEKIKVVREKLATLEKMLYGGSIMFALEHIASGEITAKFPFLTALNTADGTSAMLREIATLGVGMAALVTAVWGVWIAAGHFAKKIKSRRASSAALA